MLFFMKDQSLPFTKKKPPPLCTEAAAPSFSPEGVNAVARKKSEMIVIWFLIIFGIVGVIAGIIWYAKKKAED